MYDPTGTAGLARREWLVPGRLELRLLLARDDGRLLSTFSAAASALAALDAIGALLLTLLQPPAASSAPFA